MINCSKTADITRRLLHVPGNTKTMSIRYAYYPMAKLISGSISLPENNTLQALFSSIGHNFSVNVLESSALHTLSATYRRNKQLEKINKQKRTNNIFLKMPD